MEIHFHPRSAALLYGAGFDLAAFTLKPYMAPTLSQNPLSKCSVIIRKQLKILVAGVGFEPTTFGL